jgi:hypothetical protein
MKTPPADEPLVARSVDLQPPPELQVFAENHAEFSTRSDGVLRLNCDYWCIFADACQRMFHECSFNFIHTVQLDIGSTERADGSREPDLSQARYNVPE